jgi:autotransporter-associated beta strand protein
LAVSGTGLANKVIGGNAATASVLTLNLASSAALGAGVLGGAPATSPDNNLALTKAGAATLTLSGSQNYTGRTTISGGTLSISADNNLGAAPGAATPAHLVVNGGVLQATDTFTLDANRGVALGPNVGTGSGTIEVAATKTLTYGGIAANNGGTGSLIKTGDGKLTLTNANTYGSGPTGNNTTVSAGTLQVGNSGATGSITGNVTNNATLAFNRTGATSVGNITGTGTTTLTTPTTLTVTANYARQAALDIAAGATMEIATNPVPTNKAATVSVLTSALASPNDSLRIAAGGVFDLNNNDLVAYYLPGTGATTLSTMQQYIYDGYLNTPSVPQIKFDTLLGTFQTYAVAFDNAALTVPKTTWDGQPLSGTNQIITKYTYRGDLDLDGDVDGNDFTVVQMFFGTTGLGLGKGWMKGDADLNGVVDGNDFTVIQQNFGAGAVTPLAPPVGNVVPEPSTLALLLLAGLAALGAALRGFWRRNRR